LRAVIQRVSKATIFVDSMFHAEIGRGLVVLVGVWQNDTDDDAKFIASKIANLRIFEDHSSKFGKSAKDIRAEIMVVPQFTLFSRVYKNGRRPEFVEYADKDKAIKLLDRFIEALKEQELTVQTGVFGAHMQIELTNDGPVTIVVSTDKWEPIIVRKS